MKSVKTLALDYVTNAKYNQQWNVVDYSIKGRILLAYIECRETKKRTIDIVHFVKINNEYTVQASCVEENPLFVTPIAKKWIKWYKETNPYNKNTYDYLAKAEELYYN